MSILKALHLVQVQHKGLCIVVMPRSSQKRQHQLQSLEMEQPGATSPDERTENRNKLVILYVLLEHSYTAEHNLGKNRLWISLFHQIHLCLLLDNFNVNSESWYIRILWIAGVNVAIWPITWRDLWPSRVLEAWSTYCLDIDLLHRRGLFSPSVSGDWPCLALSGIVYALSMH